MNYQTENVKKLLASPEMAKLKRQKNLDGIINLFKKVPNENPAEFQMEKFVIAQVESNLGESGHLTYECGGCIFSWLAWKFMTARETKLWYVFDNMEIYDTFKTEDEAKRCEKVLSSKRLIVFHGSEYPYVLGWNHFVKYLTGKLTDNNKVLVKQQLEMCGAPVNPWGTKCWVNPVKIFQRMKEHYYPEK